MGDMFHAGAIRPEYRDRAEGLATLIADIFPHILGIVEAADKVSHHEAFLKLANLSSAGYSVARGLHKRGRHDLVYYYRAPFKPLAVDEPYEFFEDWVEDMDDDGIDEVCTFERRPLEVLWEIDGTDIQFRTILLATKSKGVFSVQDIFGYQHRALANRKRLVAQCRKVRRRIDSLLLADNPLPVIAMGDFNDGPGLDNYERLIGASAIETVMGSIFEPSLILHNTLYHRLKAGEDVWTTAFADSIVSNADDHKVWLDHILVSPAMLLPSSRFQLIPDSGSIGPLTLPGDNAARLSDHRPVYCRVAAKPD